MLFNITMMFSLMACLFVTGTNSPMGMMLNILFLSTFLSLGSGMLLSTWYSLIMFLVYVGGLLVMFMYITMTSSNSMMNTSVKKWLVISMMSFLAWVCLLISPLTVEPSTGGMVMPEQQAMISGANLVETVISLLIVVLLLAMLSIISVLSSGGKSVSSSV